MENQDVFESKILLNKGANPNKKHGGVSYYIHTHCIVHIYVSDEIKILNTSTPHLILTNVQVLIVILIQVYNTSIVTRLRRFRV